MSLVDQVKNHPVVVIATVALSLAGAAVGLTIKIEDSDKDAIKSREQTQVAQLKEKDAETIDYYRRLLASTQIVVGRAASAVDVSRMAVTADQIQQLPSEDRYIQQGDFYALQPRAGSGWHYRITTEPQMISDLTGASLADVKRLYQRLGVGSFTRTDVYLWRFQTPYTLRAVGTRLRLYPQVAVERLRLGPIVSAAEKQIGGNDAGARQARGLIGRFYRDDPAGALILSALILDVQSLGPLGATSSIESVEKKGTAVYARVQSTLTNVTVDGQRYARFYYAREFVIIGAGNDVFFIKTFLPSADPRSPYLAFVRAWFRLFHFQLGP